MADIRDQKDVTSRPSPSITAGGKGAASDESSISSKMDDIYSPIASNWYTAKPYGFKFAGRDGMSKYVMFLPISPSNLTINTAFATNMIPTLYGTVEEHSPVRYYDIVIEGTTGMSPQFAAPGYGDEPDKLYDSLRQRGRTTVSVSSGISAGGFFSKTLGALNAAIGKATDLMDGKPKPKTGVFDQNSGYIAFHNLYRFLLNYKKDAAGVYGDTPYQQHPLVFFNYKDNNQYKVVVHSFTLKRSAENPMLYNYSIQMRGYDITTIQNSMASDDLQRRLSDLGLDGVDGSSSLGKMKDIASQARAVVGSLVGGINVLGRYGPL